MKTHYVEVNLAITLDDDENVYEVLNKIMDKQTEIESYEINVTSTHHD